MVRSGFIKTYSNLQPVILGCHRRSPNLRHTLVHFRGFLRAAHSAKCFRLARQQANQHRTACSVLLLKHDQQALVARCGLRGLIPVIVKAAESRKRDRHSDIVLSIERLVDPHRLKRYGSALSYCCWTTYTVVAYTRADATLSLPSPKNFSLISTAWK